MYKDYPHRIETPNMGKGGEYTMGIKLLSMEDGAVYTVPLNVVTRL